MRRIVVFLMSVTVATAALIAPASAQWPDRPLKLIVPFAAGSSSDTIARIVAAKAGEKLGQQIVVEESRRRQHRDRHRCGREGRARRLHARPRQHHDACGERGAQSQPAVRSGEGFHPGGDDRLLAVRADQARRSVLGRDACRVRGSGEVQARRAELRVRPAPGTLAHLAGELFKRQAHVDITHVPYRGTAQSMSRPDAGPDRAFGQHHPADLCSRSTRASSGALAVMGEHRQSPCCPRSRPSPKRACPAARPASWTAIVVPAGTPVSDRRSGSTRIMLAVAAAPDVQQAMKIQGVDPEPGSPEARRRADQGRCREMEGRGDGGEDRGNSAVMLTDLAAR